MTTNIDTLLSLGGRNLVDAAVQHKGQCQYLGLIHWVRAFPVGWCNLAMDLYPGLKGGTLAVLASESQSYSDGGPQLDIETVVGQARTLALAEGKAQTNEQHAFAVVLAHAVQTWPWLLSTNAGAAAGATGQSPAPSPLPLAATTQLAHLLAQILEVQREQLAHARAAATAQTGGRLRSLQAGYQQEFPDLPAGCSQAVLILERAYGRMIYAMVEELSQNGEDALDNDFALSDFLDRYHTRLCEISNILNLVDPLAEPTRFKVILDGFDAAKKIRVIKVVRDLTGLSLKEAKDLVEGSPRTVQANVAKADAEKVKKQLEDAGATASLKPAG